MFFKDMYSKVFGFASPPLHDPCAAAFVLAPWLFTLKSYRVDIETRSELSAGQSVVDVWGSSTRRPNAAVAVSMDVDGFWSLMLRALDAADRASPLSLGARSGCGRETNHSNS